MDLFETIVLKIIPDCLFVPTFVDFVDYLWLFLENSSFSNL